MTNQPPTRVIMLGGSNLARGIATIVEVARQIAGGPAEFLIAKGHGRSYGQRSTVLGRSLPGIAECGLWDVLPGRGGPPTYALITDIGNDVMYGAPVASIVQWVETCVDRLLELRARVAMTMLPMASLRRLTPWRFGVARSIFFPTRRVSLAGAMACAEELDGALRALGERKGVGVVEQDGRWYGLDPIHIRLRLLVPAWSQIMGTWRDVPGTPADVRPSVRRAVQLRLLTPQRWWLLGHQRGRSQPSGRLPDGSTVSLY